MSNSDVYIVGAAETPLGEVHDHSTYSMVALAAREALDEAGLRMRDVDGLFINYMGEEGTVQLGEYLGIYEPRYVDSTDIGGGTFMTFVHHAMLAIQEGRCEVALIGYASRQRSLRLRSAQWKQSVLNNMEQFETPYGIPVPIGHFAMATARHMHQFGTTREQLAEIPLAARKWAQLNPKAWHQDPLTLDDVMNSRMIADPMRRHDCCLITDGGGVIIVTGADRARDARKKPVRVLGAGESQRTWHISQIPDIVETPALQSGRDAFGMAGITPADVDVLEAYDAFTITPLLAIEDLGFCEKGEVGAFVEDGRTAPGGDFPMNTSGGGLSYCHPGALGMLVIIEAVRQARGEAGARQVPDVEIAVAHGIGGLMSSASTLALACD